MELSPPDVVPLYTLYPVTAAPPLLDGAVHDKETKVLPELACRFCGAEGTEAGISCV